MPWTDLEPESSTFTTTNMIIPYKGAISKQFLGKIVNNTGFNFQLGHLIYTNNATFASGSEKTFDTDRNYSGKTIFYIYLEYDGPLNSHATPWAMGSPFPVGQYIKFGFITLTEAYDNEISGWWDIKAESDGGFTVKDKGDSGTCYLRLIVTQITLDSGS